MESLIQIVYQNGELQTEDSKFLFIPIDVWFTALLTVILFFAGYLANSLVGKWQAKKRRTDLRQYFSLLIQMLKSPVEKQVGQLHKFSESLLAERMGTIAWMQITSFNVEQLKKIDTQDLYEIFITYGKGVSNDKARRLQSVLESIRYMDEVKLLMPGHFNEFRTALKKQEHAFAEHIGLLSNHIEAFNSKLARENIHLGTDSFMLTANQIREKWFTQGQPEIPFQDIFIAKLHFIDPIWSLCKKTLGDERSDILLIHAMECARAFENYAHLRKHYAGSFKEDANNILLSWNVLINAVSDHDGRQY